MKIFIFGNEDLEMDSLPLRILPKLKEKFPEIEFVTADPNEDFDFPENVVVIDTTVGIKDVTVFDSLEKFSAPPRIGMHDFDALTNLRLLWKLGKIKKIKIIAVPPEIGKSEVVEKISEILQKIKKENAGH
jgi:Ni,Fe-hydrogenase maturation factor